MSQLSDPILRRTFECAIDYDDKADLITKIEAMKSGLDSNDESATVNHPDWLRTRFNCCGGSGP